MTTLRKCAKLLVNLTKSQLHVPSIISNITDIKNNVEKPVRLTCFQKPQLQSILTFFKFVHQCLLVYYTIWWQFPLSEFR